MQTVLNFLNVGTDIFAKLTNFPQHTHILLLLKLLSPFENQDNYGHTLIWIYEVICTRTWHYMVLSFRIVCRIVFHI